MPAVDPRVERLDPAVEHLGEPGHRGHVGHGQAGVAQRPCGAAGRDELEPAGDEARDRGRPAQSCPRPTGARGAGRERARRRARGRRVTWRPSGASSAPASEERDRPRQQPVLDRPDPVVEARHVVVRAGPRRPPGRRSGRRRGSRPRDGRCSRSRSTPWASASATAWAPGNAGSSDGMGVEDPSAERGEDRRADDPHVARRGRPRRRRRAARVAARVASSPPGIERGLDPLLRRPVERRAGAVGEDERRSSPPSSPRRGRGERPQVRPGARDADRDPAGRRDAHANRSSGPST